VAEVRGTVQIDRSPDEVWKVIADFGNLAWLGVTTRMEADDRRIVEMGPGFEITEQRIEQDDDARRLVYEIAEAPFELDSYVATITVEPDGDGSLVTWLQQVSPDELEAVMAPVNENGLKGLKAQLEGS
jgi:hypothetical protein